jgi:hypothetical protein
MMQECLGYLVQAQAVWSAPGAIVIDSDLQACMIRVFFFAGIKESDTGLAAPSQWDLVSDKQAMQEEQPLQVGIMDAR